MRRMLSFRDFDWLLLGLVVLVCTVSVLEIYSGDAAHEVRRVPYQAVVLGRRRGGGHVSAGQGRLSQAAGFRALGLWVLSRGAGGGADSGYRATRRLERAGGSKLDQFSFNRPEWMKLVIILMVARYFANLGGRSLDLAGDHEGLRAGRIPMLLILKQPDLGTSLHLHAGAGDRAVCGGINLKQSLVLVTAAAVVLVGVEQRQAAETVSEGAAHGLHQSRQRPAGRGIPGAAGQDRRGRGGSVGQGSRKRDPDPGSLHSHSARRLHLRRLQRGTRVRGRGDRLLGLYFAILMRLIQNAQTAGDLPERSDYAMGVVAVIALPDRRQCGHGDRLYACYRTAAALVELWRIFGPVYVPGTGRGYEHTDATICKLGTKK